MSATTLHHSASAPAIPCDSSNWQSTSSRRKSLGKAPYNDYLAQADLQRGLKSGQLFSGKLRVNVNDRTEAYVTVEGMPYDVFLKGPAQNRALDGDVVALQLEPISSWRERRRDASGGSAPGSHIKDPPSSDPSPPSQPPPPPSPSPSRTAVDPLSFLSLIKSRMPGASPAATPTPSGPGDPSSPTRQGRPWTSAGTAEGAVQLLKQELERRPNSRPTGRVVAILEPSSKRELVVGVLAFVPGSNQVQLIPADPRLPSMALTHMDVGRLPEALQLEVATKDVPRRTLVSARVVEWRADCGKARAAVRQSIGQAGDIESETQAILMLQQVNTAEFSEEVLACLPQGAWAIDQEEVDKRRDFRSTRIFSIDPPTARDLDDALSVEALPGGGFRVGVHIADVAHFLRPGTALDKEAAARSTSVYLVDRVVPMLPRLLCENLCSLNAGVDRLAFSMTWDMDPSGEILAVWAGRSVICSCAKLAYHHAQEIIEGGFNGPECGVELHGGYSWAEVTEDVLALHALASRLREGRFAAGALKLDNVKLHFTRDDDGNPVEALPYRQMEANWLVEEMMLLANRTAAKITADAFPQLAVLRRHSPPDADKLEEVAALAEAVGVKLLIHSSSALQASLEQLRRSCREPALAAAVQNLATKPMQLAKYFCTGTTSDSWRHYALAVEHYTHFTSPIRRYPDIMVHRLLAAALELGPPTVEGGPTAAPEEATRVAIAHSLLPADAAQVVAEHANDRKLAARNVQDSSSRLYLAVLLRKRPVIAHAVMLQPAGDKFVGVYLPDFGCECKIEYNQCTTPAAAAFDKESATVTLLPPADGSSLLASFVAPAAPRRPAYNNSATPSNRNADFDEGAWAASLANLANPSGLRPLPLPATLRAFVVVPVVVGAYVSVGVAGHPVDVAVRLYTGDALPTVG